tara:strand:+ start:484 stop:816 length:333 start_codon:yes stop_codon:yes gene_type:complete
MREDAKEQLLKNGLRYNYDQCNNIYTIPVPIKKRDNQLYFTCPFCHTNYKKNGAPYKNCEFKNHIHGNDGMDIDKNYGVRTPHCDMKAKIYWGLDTINYEFKLIGGNLIY